MKSKLKINFLYSFIYQLLLIILPLITAPYVSRVLGSEGVGIYSYTYSVSSCFAMFGLLGVANYGNRIIASNRDNKNIISELFSDIWMIQQAMTYLTLFIYVIYTLFVAEVIYRAALLIQILIILCSCTDISWFFWGLEEFKLTVVRNLIIKCLTTISIFLFVKSNDDLLIYIAILCIGMISGNLLLFPFLKKYIHYSKPSIKRMRQHFTPLLVLFVPVLAVNLYKKMDKIMIGIMSTMTQTGYYENAEKIINIPMSLITALGIVMMPRMSYLIGKGEKKQIEYYLKTSVEFTFFLASALMFGIAGVANEFIPLFYGNEFYPVAGIIKVISFTLLFISLANIVRTQYLIPKHYDKVYIISVWAGAFVNLILNYFLIPINAALGASYATVLAEFTVMIIQIVYVWKEIPILTYLKKGLYYIADGFVMFLAVRFSANYYNGWMGIIFEIAVGALIYLAFSIPYVVVTHKISVRKFIKG